MYSMCMKYNITSRYTCPKRLVVKLNIKKLFLNFPVNTHLLLVHPYCDCLCLLVTLAYQKSKGKFMGAKLHMEKILCLNVFCNLGGYL